MEISRRKLTAIVSVVLIAVMGISMFSSMTSFVPCRITMYADPALDISLGQFQECACINPFTSYDWDGIVEGETYECPVYVKNTGSMGLYITYLPTDLWFFEDMAHFIIACWVIEFGLACELYPLDPWYPLPEKNAVDPMLGFYLPPRKVIKVDIMLYIDKVVVGELYEWEFTFWGSKAGCENPLPAELVLDKFNDLNGNGVYDAGDVMIADWRIDVLDPHGSTTTHSTPTVVEITEFGTYTITEDSPAGWEQTAVEVDGVYIHPATPTVMVDINAGETHDVLYGSRETIYYVGRDLTTQGDWIEGEYGGCGYALPYAESKRTVMAIGETTGIGESAHEYWWREPWSVEGEKYYPYEDYRGGNVILEYEVMGPEDPPRALVDADSMYYRPSWYCNDSSVTVTLNGMAGDYRVSVYLLDWDAPSGGERRRLRVNVTSSGNWDSVDLGNPFVENFAAGTYAIFEVNSGGTIAIEVTNLFVAERYAVISGIFLDSISGPITGVTFVGTDRDTKGNWRPSYGNDFYLLPGFNVPLSGISYKPIVKAHDETNIPSENYDVSEGACQYAADDARTHDEYPYTGQYSAYAWTEEPDRTAGDTRLLIYPEDKTYYGYPPTPLDGRIFAVWHTGELDEPLNYFTMKVNIPEGEYIFSVYAVDFERISRSETVEIWDNSMTTLLDSRYIPSDQINNGVYVQWFIRGPRTINIKVIADPGNINGFINGIFLNCLG